MRSRDATLTDSELVADFNKYDTDKSGSIDLTEFRKANQCGYVYGVDVVLLVAVVTFILGWLIPLVALSLAAGDSNSTASSDVAELSRWTAVEYFCLVWICVKVLAWIFGLFWAVHATLRTVIPHHRMKSDMTRLAAITYFVVLRHAYEITDILLAEEIRPLANSVLDGAMTISVLAAWNASLDALHAGVVEIAALHSSYTTQSKCVSKWRGIMKSFSEWGPGKEAQDAAYHVAGRRNSAIGVLSSMFGCARSPKLCRQTLPLARRMMPCVLWLTWACLCSVFCGGRYDLHRQADRPRPRLDRLPRL